MAGESCNLNKDEAEILKPSSSSSPSPSPPPPPPSPTRPALFVKPSSQEFPTPERPERLEAAPAATSGGAISPLRKPDEEFRSTPPPVQSINRCLICRKRVGLTAFRCRCGDLFCSRHRHSETHDCSFDYKAAGREQIAKANPLIRAAKIIKI